MHEANKSARKLAGARYAGEIVIPPRKRRHGKGFTPERAIPWGSVSQGTALLDRFDGLHEAVIEHCRGGLGQVTLRSTRPKRADGSRGMPRDSLFGEVRLDERQRLRERAGLDAEFSCRMQVERAITQGQFVHKGVHVVVQLGAGGRVKTIPDKGRAITWASVSDLAAALACGAF